ncbi:MAG: ATP-binding protein [Candidatus Eisenbacteria bacterium]
MDRLCRLEVAAIVHYEQAFFIRQIIAASVPLICLLVRQSIPALMPAFYLAAGATGLNLFYYWLTVTRRFRPSFKWAQIALDMLLWTTLIHFTGGKESVFFFLYPLEILVAAFTLSASGCIYAAVLAGAFYSVEVGILRSPPATEGSQLIKLVFLAAVAVLSVLIVKKLERKTREVRRLSEQLRERAERAEGGLGAVFDGLGTGLIIIEEGGDVLRMNRPFASKLGLDGSPAPQSSRSASVLAETAPAPRAVLKTVISRLLASLPTGRDTGNARITVSDERGAQHTICLTTRVFQRHGKRCVMAIEQGEPGDTSGPSDSTLVAAHEVKNSMTCVLGLLSLLREDLPDRPEAAQLMAKIAGAVEGVDRFVSDLLLYSKRVEPRLEKADLVRILDSVAEHVALGKENNQNVSFLRDFRHERLEALVDPWHVQRMTMNLLINACHAVGDGGTVMLSLRNEDRCAVIEVRDNGCGIPPEHLGRVFEPLFTTKGTGNGLGLAIVKKLVEAHNGVVSVTSSLESGTTFTLRLPLGASPQLICEPVLTGGGVSP